MKNENETPVIYLFDEQAVRVLGTPEEPLFVATDVCKALEIENSRHALSLSIPDEEKGVAQSYTLGGNQTVAVLKESGLYRLIFRSDKPKAELFRQWVFREVLPAIRRTGCYGQQAWLRQAYASARTGAAQVEVLRLMRDCGAIMPAEAQRPSPKPLGHPRLIDLERLWAVITSEVVAGRIKPEEFRIVNGFLYFKPLPICEAIATAAEFDGVLRRDLRASFEAGPDWMATSPGGVIKQRFMDGSALGSPAICWAVRITDPVLELAEIIRQKVEINLA